MKRIKIKVGAVIMLAVMLISDRADVFFIYMLSAGLHEIGHLMAAAVMKIPIKEICFDYSGVRICIGEGMLSYKREILLAAAGPCVNFTVLLAVMSYFSRIGTGFESALVLCSEYLAHGGNGRAGALAFLALSSLIQGASNLLPVRSFDGGRIVNGLAALAFGERAAERTVDILSAFSAFILWTVSLYLLLRVSSGIGIYAFAACIFLSCVKEKR